MQVLKKYFDLKTQIKSLTDQLKEIEQEVMKEVALSETGKLETPFARFQVVYRPKWEYSEKLTETLKIQAEKVKLLKKKEELDGTAKKVSDGGQLRMTDVKE